MPKHLLCGQFIYISMVPNCCREMKNYFNWFFFHFIAAAAATTNVIWANDKKTQNLWVPASLTHWMCHLVYCDSGTIIKNLIVCLSFSFFLSLCLFLLAIFIILLSFSSLSRSLSFSLSVLSNSLYIYLSHTLCLSLPSLYHNSISHSVSL